MRGNKLDVAIGIYTAAAAYAPDDYKVSHIGKIVAPGVCPRGPHVRRDQQLAGMKGPTMIDKDEDAPNVPAANIELVVDLINSDLLTGIM